MSSQCIEAHRDKAEIYHGHEICQKKSVELLEELSLPNGLLPLDEIVEVGINRSTRFLWLKQKKSKSHVFRKTGNTVSYAEEITGFFDKCKLMKLTGVKGKKLLVCVTVSDIFIDDPDSGKISFKTPSGLSRSYPASAYELEDEKTNK